MLEQVRGARFLKNQTDIPAYLYYKMFNVMNPIITRIYGWTGILF